MSDNVVPMGTPEVPAEQGPPLAEPQASAPAAPVEGTAPQSTPVDQEKAQKPGMHSMISESYSYQQSKRGEIRRGRVLAIKDEGIVVDLGLKREGFVPQDDVRQVGPDAVAALQVGDEIPVLVLRPENDKEGNVLVSWQRARQEQDWLDAQRLQETGEVWVGTVKGYNRGGLIVHYGKIRGFVPASQITGVSRRLDSTSLQARLAEMVGQELPFRVIEVDRENRRLILSERTARREWRAKQREKLLSELQEGDIVPGVVRNICDFGIFVDLGGTDGLVHISELSWRRTNHPSEVVKVGDEVQAYVLRVDRENRRIGLSLRLAAPDPWSTVEERYAVGDLVPGTITKLIAFGAFAALDDGIEGLIHITELSEIPPKHPSEVVQEDQVLPLRIVKIDTPRRRMGLSWKRVTEEERAEWEACHQAAPEEEASLEGQPPPEEPPVEVPEGELPPEELPPEELAAAPVEEPPVEELAAAPAEEPPVEEPAAAPVEEPPVEAPPEEPPEASEGEATPVEPPPNEPSLEEERL